MTKLELKRNDRFGTAGRTLCLAILDGVGSAPPDPGNAVAAAPTPWLDLLEESCPGRTLRAHGTAVGLPSDEDMGNSEVGHNALGAGRIFDQGAKLVNQALADGSLFGGSSWRKLVDRVRERGSTLHLLGLLSDGNVHSHIDHLLALLRQAAKEGVARVRIHVLLDGRDVPETSSPLFVARLEAALAELAAPDRDYRIASGGGRMVTTMDRYEADWRIVERGWRTHVHGQGRGFPTALAAIETLRRETGANDQFLPPFVITGEAGRPVGPIRDGDAVVFFNFRGDRALEISRAFVQDAFPPFDRSPRPEVAYAGMMQYDGDTLMPPDFLVTPPRIARTMGEHLAAAGRRQLAAAETQKFGHVTYFWNGNRTGFFDPDLETYLETPSDRVPFEQRPWMKAAEVWDSVLAETARRHYDFVRLNLANGDMVGHTGSYGATVVAVAAVDLTVGRILRWAGETGAIVVVTADHGNADQMFRRDRQTGAVLLDPGTGRPQPMTAHTLNPVPFWIHDPHGTGFRLRSDLPGAGLANVAATLLDLMGFAAPEGFEPSLLA